MCRVPSAVLSTVCVLLALVLLDTPQVVHGAVQNNCVTIMSELVITKEKYQEYNGRKLKPLLCVGKIPIRKCEGTCVSKVSPSVVHFPGFKKDCKCCRETMLVNRLVRLTECYDGTSLIPGQDMKFFLKEPQNCQCYDCAM